MTDTLSAAGWRTIYWMAALCAIPLVCAAAAFPQLQPVFLVCLVFSALVAYSHFQLDGLVVVFLICQSLVHLLKRLIFVFGPQPQAVYFGVQLLPTAVLFALFAVVVRRLRGKKLPLSARLLTAFLALAVATTLVSLNHEPWIKVLSAIHQQLLPFLMFYAGLLLTPEKFARVGRTLGILAGVSVLYGGLQLAGGPTALDRAWAGQTYSYSIQGGKVFRFVEGESTDFRSYSYYADPLTWGLFLLAGLAGATVARELGRMSRVLFLGIVVLVLAGLFFSLTRTVWVGLLVMLGAFALLRYRTFRRPWLVFCLVLGSLSVTILAGDSLYRELFVAQRLPVFQSAIVSRYLTVGTIEARIGAWTSLKDAVSTSLWGGQGYGMRQYANLSRDDPQADLQNFSHNFLVELVINVGVPGALLFLWFYWQWLREGLGTLRRASNREHRRLECWILAFSVGQVITGYLNGLNFMNSEFFLIMGVLAGAPIEWAAVRVSCRARDGAPSIPLPALKPVYAVRGGVAG